MGVPRDMKAAMCLTEKTRAGKRLSCASHSSVGCGFNVTDLTMAILYGVLK